MHLDIRLPIGALFFTIGAIITAYGALGDPAVYERSLGYNVNLWWGIVLIAFGVLMLFLGRKRTSGIRTADESPEGRAIEAMEHERGEESVG